MNAKRPFLGLLGLALLSSVLIGCGQAGSSSEITSSGSGEYSSLSSDSTASSDPSSTSSSASSSSSGSSSSSDPDPVGEATIPETLIIHYQMSSPDYGNKAFWIWTAGTDGQLVNADEVDSFGMKLTLHPLNDYPTHDTFYFIIRNKANWTGQSLDTVIDYETYRADSEGLLEVWCMDGEGNQIDVYKNYADTQGYRLATTKFSDWKTVHCVATGECTSYTLYALDASYFALSDTIRPQKLPNYIIASGSPNAATFDIALSDFQAPNKLYQIKCVFSDAPEKSRLKNVSMELLYDTSRFTTYYTYSGNDLGVTYTHDYTEFRLWAPTAAEVKVRLYVSGTPKALADKPLSYLDNYLSYNMEFSSGGVWYGKIAGDMDGYYYTYSITNSEGTNEVVDPYAHSTGVNGVRGMIMDMSTTDPEGWDDIPLVWNNVEGYDISSPDDLVVYECHIRDLTMDDTWGGTEEPGTYKAFSEAGTSYTDEATTKSVTTGYDHIAELGVNAVQLLPVFDHDNEERAGKRKFNWGYNPLNYNVVEGSYSSNPNDGKARVREFKELVMAYANNGSHCRIIMDVVYNHVSSVSSSNFTKIMPKYYFRIASDGSYYDGSGCGNEVKTEAPMMRKFIVDSVSFWASEYKVKGFRFDLMGLIDTTTMKEVKDAVYAIDHDNVCYGEGWTSGGYHGSGSGADSGKVYSSLYPSSTSPGILGGFNDAGRNAIRGENTKGGWGSDDSYPGYGFISQGSSDVASKAATVGDMLKGVNSNAGANPMQTVNYASCHDNYTVFDQLNYALSESPSYPPTTAQEPAVASVCQASLAVHTAIMVSNGISFMQGGEELFRSKVVDDPDNQARTIKPYPDTLGEGESWSAEVRMYGKIISHNSYNLTDDVNAFQWDRKLTINGTDVSSYSDGFKTAINARKSLPKHSFPDNCDSSYLNAFNVDSGSTALGFYIGGNANTYYFAMSGRSTNTLALASANSMSLIFSGGSISLTSTGVQLGKYSFALLKA